MQIAIKKTLGNFSLDVRFTGEENGITALCGPSGSGKTSVINMVAGLIRPDAGHISIAGRCLFDSEKGIDLAPEKRRMGYVFQEGRLFPHLSIRANLTYGMRLVPRARRSIQFDEVLALLGIEHLVKRRPRNLSGGEKQRVAIGRALLTSPAALLMDEPFASLDEARKQELLPFISSISREFSIPVLYVSHAMEEVRSLAKRTVHLENGRTSPAPGA